MLPDLTRHRGDRHLAAMRLMKQGLVGAPFASPTEVVDALCAVQSQDYPGARWGVAQRCGATRAEVDAAFDRGDLLRTHVLRPTWHLVRPADLHWMLEVSAPRVLAASRPYFEKFDIDAKLLVKSDAAIAARLAAGCATRPELAEALDRAGVEASGLRLAYVVIHAELAGLVVSGPMRGKQHTYALADQRAPRPASMDRRDAIVRLARRYFAAHGPATVHDFAWWSWLPVSEARLGVEALGAGFVGTTTERGTYWFGDSKQPLPEGASAHLLPNYDELLIAYKDHGVSYDPGLATAAAPRGVVSGSHSVVVNGLVVGSWRREGAGKKARIEHDLWVRLGRDAKRALDAAIARATEHHA